MKRFKIYVLLLLTVPLFVLTVAISIAQSTEQAENECYEGGSLDGLCSVTDVDRDGDVDQFDIDWMYTCGYYLSQVDDEVAIGNDEIPLEGCRKQERIIPRPEKPKPTREPDPKPKPVVSVPS